MISQENTDERLTETSSSSYDTDYEIILTVTSKIKRSTGKKKKQVIIFVFQHFSLEKEYWYLKSVLYLPFSSFLDEI